jgi:DNA-binding MarR family transcriptional regulator
MGDGLGYLLVLVGRAMRYHHEAHMSTLGLHAGQELVLLELLREDGLTQTQIAAKLGVEPPTVTKMLSRMERGELVERRTDPEDARVTRVYLTERSRGMAQSIQTAWDSLETMIKAGLSDIEQALVRRILLHMLDNLSKTESGD